MFRRKFPFYRQPDRMDCGPTCLRMILKFYGLSAKLQTIREFCEINREGVSFLGLKNAAEKFGMSAAGSKLSLSQLADIELPCILHWRQYHYVVLFKIKRGEYFIADPTNGLISLAENDFKKFWISTDNDRGFCLSLYPTNAFYEQSESYNKINWKFLSRYFFKYRQLVVQLILGLTIGSLLQLIAPFLTQSIVDIGIDTKNLNFIYIVLIAQAALFLGRLSVEFIRSWILLHISTRINISLLTDFLVKLMKLPISFFDTKMTGDIMQRMNDQRKIETFLTGSTLNTIFSFFNLLIFSAVLFSYKVNIFFVFFIASSCYVGWIFIFLRKRRALNYKNFEVLSKNQSYVVQMIGGMQEIKLNNCEKQTRWEWEDIQVNLFKFSIKNLTLTQYQQAGATFINEGKNLLITFLSAKAVIDGTLTLGEMVAIQYIIGQLNGPIEQFLNFMLNYQDAKISLERLNEIHDLQDEESTNKNWNQKLPKDKSILIKDVTFSYPGAGNEPVLKSITMQIPQGKTTAIVGMSGSGKTTIIKLLLRFYAPADGQILIGEEQLNDIAYPVWRSQCGVVLQDGFIFSDTIERNIAVGEEKSDTVKLENAIRIANIGDFIKSLALGLQTKIGAEGNGISQGQRQRILIARAAYKNPEYLFFDEATNALDANNERIIMDNLNEFFSGRTVLVVAHRLSTVKNADNIIVMQNGQIVEQGTHEKLTNLKGSYFDLVSNQLELGA